MQISRPACKCGSPCAREARNVLFIPTRAAPARLRDDVVPCVRLMLLGWRWDARGSCSRGRERCSGFQGNEKPERLGMKSGLWRKPRVLKESKCAALASFSLSVLFGALFHSDFRPSEGLEIPPVESPPGRWSAPRCQGNRWRWSRKACPSLDWPNPPSKHPSSCSPRFFTRLGLFQSLGHVLKKAF